MTDHINNVERKLIDNLRHGKYRTVDGIDSGSAWTSGSVEVYGQFPETVDIKYPCVVLELRANGTEEQFYGQSITSGASVPAIGELYGVGFDVWCAVDIESSVTVDATPYKQRRLMNYLMLNTANIVMDCDFGDTSTTPYTEVVDRHYTGFRDIGYNPDTEVWFARASLLITFKNAR